VAAKAERGKSVPITLFLPARVVKEARELGVKLAVVVRQTLKTFVERSELPPVELRAEDKTRVDVRVPREVAEKLKERGGPSAAAWFVAKKLEVAVETAKRVMSMSLEEFIAEYVSCGSPARIPASSRQRSQGGGA